MKALFVSAIAVKEIIHAYLKLQLFRDVVC